MRNLSTGDVEPKLAILDETDSGLDIDALRIVANGVNKLRSAEKQQVLSHITRDYWITSNLTMFMFYIKGKIVKSGTKRVGLAVRRQRIRLD